MDISINREERPSPSECLNFLILHISALHRERDDYPPPENVNEAIDRIHDYLLGNG